MDSLDFEEAHVEEWEKVDPEWDPKNNDLCHQPFVAGWLVESARFTGGTRVNDVAIDKNSEAVKRVKASYVPHPHEVDADADHSHQDGGAQPFDNVVNTEQQNYVIEDQAGLFLLNRKFALFLAVVQSTYVWVEVDGRDAANKLDDVIYHRDTAEEPVSAVLDLG